MKKQFAIPAVSVVAGIVGGILRHIQINTVFEADTGLAKTMAPVSVALCLLSVLVVAASLIFGKKTTTETKDSLKFSEAFGCGKISFVISVLAGFVMAVCSVIRESQYLVYYGSFAVNIFAILGFATGISVIAMAIFAYKGKNSIELYLFSVIPVAFYCYIMAAEYKAGSTSPVLINYCYGCIAFGAAAVSHYVCSGFVFDRAKAWLTAAIMPISVYFMTVTLADDRDIYMTLIILAELIVTLLNFVNFILSPNETAFIKQEIKEDNDNK